MSTLLYEGREHGRIDEEEYVGVELGYNLCACVCGGGREYVLLPQHPRYSIQPHTLCIACGVFCTVVK